MSKPIKTYLQKYGFDFSNPYNYSETFHEDIVSLINRKEYNKVVLICLDLIELYPDIDLIPLIIFTFINHKEFEIVLKICDKILEVAPNHKILFDILEKLEQLYYFNPIIDLCIKFLNTINRKKLMIIYDLISKFLSHDLFNSNYICKLITAVLQNNPQDIFIINIIPKLIKNNIYNNKLVKVCRSILDASVSPHIVHYLINIFQKLLDNGKYNMALQVSKELFSKLPQSPEVWLMVGGTYTKLGNYTQAFNAYRNALKYSDTKLTNKICISFAWMYICLGKYDKAIKLLLKSKDRENKTLYDNYLGFAYFKNGNPKEGIELIKSSIMLDKNYCHAWINLAKVELELHNHYASFCACFECLKINNQYQEALDLY